MATTRERKPAAAAQPDLEKLKRPWRAFVTDRRLNESKTREAVVDTFLESSDHVDLATLHERVRRTNPHVGMATVYRTMKLLEEAGLAQARDFGGRNTIYEVAVGREHHDHLICESCGTIVEFVSEPIERQQESVAARHGFELRRHKHELFGLCAKCRGRA
jgi:Fur family ferric uptake transcriptional regulator